MFLITTGIDFKCNASQNLWVSIPLPLGHNTNLWLYILSIYPLKLFPFSWHSIVHHVLLVNNWYGSVLSAGYDLTVWFTYNRFFMLFSVFNVHN
jgi:hypothetical protein